MTFTKFPTFKHYNQPFFLFAFFIMSHWANSFFLSQQAKQYPVSLPVALWHSVHWYTLSFLRIFFFIYTFFLSSFLKIRNLWKVDNFHQHVVQNRSILYAAVVPQFGHLCIYICFIFSTFISFIIPSIPQNKDVVKGLLSIFNLVRIMVKGKDSIFNFVRIMVAARINLWIARISSAECPTRPAHSTAQHGTIIQHTINKNAGKMKYPAGIIMWEYG